MDGLQQYQDDNNENDDENDSVFFKDDNDTHSNSVEDEESIKSDGENDMESENGHKQSLQDQDLDNAEIGVMEIDDLEDGELPNDEKENENEAEIKQEEGLKKAKSNVNGQVKVEIVGADSSEMIIKKVEANACETKVNSTDKEDLDKLVLGPVTQDDFDAEFNQYALDMLRNSMKSVKTHRKGLSDNNTRRYHKSREMRLVIAAAKKDVWHAKKELIGKQATMEQLSELENLSRKALTIEKEMNIKLSQINNAETSEWQSVEMQIKRTWNDYGTQVMNKFYEVEKKKSALL